MVRRRSFGRVCVLIARVVAGRTLLHTILRAPERVSFNHDPLQFLLVETSYQPLVSFFNLTGMANQHHELKAIREWHPSHPHNLSHPFIPALPSPLPSLSHPRPRRRLSPPAPFLY